MSARNLQWRDANARRLLDGIASVHARLGSGDPPPAPRLPVDGRRMRLDHLIDRLALSAAESDLLLLAAGIALLPELAANPPPIGALMAPADPFRWAALAPNSALWRYRLIAIPEDASPIAAHPRICRWLLAWLSGHSDEVGPFRPMAAQTDHLPAPWLGAAQDGADRLRGGIAAGGSVPALVLSGHGASRADRLAVATALLREVGLAALPGVEEAPAPLLERALLLTGSVPVLDPSTGNALALAEALPGPVLLLGDAGGLRRPCLTVDLPPLAHPDRVQLWQRALGDVEEGAVLDRLAWQFLLPPAAIRHAAATAPSAPEERRLATAWVEARRSARADAGPLATRMEPSIRMEDLLLPPAQLASLGMIAMQLRHQALVHGRWGMGGAGTRGLGIAALFAGPSGTGKTMAAEALAHGLGLDLLHVDLSQMMSKYIGETEKNLDRLFAAADTGGAVLLFDEADSLFGKRTEAKDSHDRYANLEVSYLLQRMEAYRGLAILTTNQKAEIDQAFLRRIRIAVHFPFPDQAMRERLWRQALPAERLAETPDWAALARLALAGGSIRTVALNAAFQAADDGGGITPAHLSRAIAAEGTKLERPQMMGTRMAS